MPVERHSASFARMPLASSEIDAVYSIALRLARRILPTCADAEDAVQTSFAQLCCHLQMNEPIDNIKAWVLKCVTNNAISIIRQNRRSVQDENLLNTEPDPVTHLDMRDILVGASEHIKRHNINTQALMYVIAKEVLFGEQNVNRRNSLAENICLATSGYSHRHIGRLLSNSLQEAQKTQKQLNDHHPVKYGFNIQLLCLSLGNIEALSTNQHMTDLMGNICATFVSEVQSAAKKCRIDLILRSGTDRHLLYDSRLIHYRKYLDLLYMAAKLPRDCMILGAVSYLHQLAGKRLSSKLLVNEEYIESFLVAIITDAGFSYLDKWLAIIALGLHFERIKHSEERAYRLFSRFELSAVKNPVQRVGIAFAYLDAATTSKQAIIADKVLQLVRPDREGDLSLLPITIMGTFLGSDAGMAVQGTRLKLLWDVTLRALASRSPLAILGGLRHLYHIESIDNQILTNAPMDELKIQLARIAKMHTSSVIGSCLSDLQVSKND